MADTTRKCEVSDDVSNRVTAAFGLAFELPEQRRTASRYRRPRWSTATA
jgi:hypothetical protein